MPLPCFPALDNIAALTWVFRGEGETGVGEVGLKRNEGVWTFVHGAGSCLRVCSFAGLSSGLGVGRAPSPATAELPVLRSLAGSYSQAEATQESQALSRLLV